jgi:hypothetical protein
MDTWYALRADDRPRVRHGEVIAAGDVIAAGSGFPTLIAFAAPLRLSVEAAVDAIARCDGIDYPAGASLGERRVGLRTQKIAAPISGIARGLPHSGALAIQSKTAEHEIRACYGGTVRDISQRAIIVTSAVARCGYAFADEIGDAPPLHIEPALLDAAVTNSGIPHPPRTATMVVAHIAETAHLKSVSQSPQSTLMIGSVTEPVACALLDRLQEREPESRRGNGPTIVVLDGVGDAQAGIRAVAPFRSFHGAHATLDRFTQTITIIPPGDALPEHISDVPSDNESTQQRDPTHYGVACTVQSAPFIALIGSGERALCVEAGESPQRAVPIPVQNVERSDWAEGSYVR